METWPPPPSGIPPEPNTKPVQNKDVLEYFAFAFSAAFILIVVADTVGVHNGFLNMFRLPAVVIGSILGVVRHSTLLGRLALLAPFFYVGLIAYTMLGWHGVLPQ